MEQFPRTLVGGISLPRLIIGSNWFLGYSHTSLAKDHFIKQLQTRDKITDILTAFLERDIDAVMAPAKRASGICHPGRRAAHRQAHDPHLDTHF